MQVLVANTCPAHIDTNAIENQAQSAVLKITDVRLTTAILLMVDIQAFS